MLSNNTQVFPSGRSLRNCRSDAKRLSRSKNIPLHQALDEIAKNNGMDVPWAKAVSILSSGQDSLASISVIERMMTIRDIEVVMNMHPRLTHFGIGISYRPSMTADERTDSFNKNRAALLDAVDECNKACMFLRHVNKRKTLNDSYGSYGLKHRVEHYMKRIEGVDNYYVANGSFICAAIYMGFEYDQIRSMSPNVSFNVSSRS
ncbi:MAG: hypothetical protein WA123_12490, partial [Methylotenera sp.]